MAKEFGFPKSQKLCSKKHQAELFEKGVSVFLYPYKLYFLEVPDLGEAKLLISCPKKKVPLSVKRKKIIRRIRESYRLQRAVFFNQWGMPKGVFAIVYLSNEIIDYPTLFEKLNQVFKRLKNQIH